MRILAHVKTTPSHTEGKNNFVTKKLLRRKAFSQDFFNHSCALYDVVLDLRGLVWNFVEARFID